MQNTEMKYKYILPTEWLKSLIKEYLPENLPVVYKSDFWKAYVTECKRLGRKPFAKSYVYKIMDTYGYTSHKKNGRPCFWMPGTIDRRTTKGRAMK